MEQQLRKKILFLDELIKKVEYLKQSGKVIVQTHGVFDLIHPGVINHLISAKKNGDYLVVTVIKDKDVRRGPGRPIFPEDLRIENVATLEIVDYTCLVDDETPFECINKIKPDIFAKGQAYKERDRRIHEKIFKEEREFYFGKTKIIETSGFSFSTSQIINNFLEIYPEETKAFLKNFSNSYTFTCILESLEKLKKLRILLVGDGIIDEYHYCSSMGKSAKSPIVVNKYITHEVFAGGAFAVANHVSGLCNNVHLVTLLGNNKSKEDYILNKLKPNVRTKFFFRDDAPTIVKKRYINQYLNQKLFEINYLNDISINDGLEVTIIEYLSREMPKHDLVLISDFGHGFITKKIIDTISRQAKAIAVNAQTNAANVGYNLITKYQRPNYVCMDEDEARLAAQEKYQAIDDVAYYIKQTLKTDNLIITLGKKGSIGINIHNEICYTPIFSTKVVDTVGAGDAFFAFTAPLAVLGLPLELISFIGNAVGALAVQIMGNKKPVEKYELLEFIHTILK
jgi:rfaE bifunctional protein kinase chain/domain/rfaE bifunctional protein nucleotidyltransferase chain/domain